MHGREPLLAALKLLNAWIASVEIGALEFRMRARALRIAKKSISIIIPYKFMFGLKVLIANEVLRF